MSNRRSMVRLAVWMVAIGAAALFAAGCKNAEAQVVGTWTGASGAASVTFKADKTFDQAKPVAVTGKWTVSDKKVSMTVDTVAGKPAKEVLAMIDKAGLPKDMLEQAKAQLEKPSEFTLSDDGKTMSMVNPPKGVTSAQATLTKQGDK